MPVSPNMKVYDLLKTHPELLDTLVEQSPHFSRLRNPVLRRVLPRLVTVAQAAAMGGLEPAALVRNLNRALGEADAEVGPIDLGSMADTPPPPWYETAPIAVTLDVREAQRRKEEPFSAIMAAVEPIEVGQVFLLRNSFEPLPLYDVLGKRGFVPWARKNAADDWEVYFFRAGKGPGQAPNGRMETRPLEHAGEEVTLTIDVRDLVPPQPMMRILDALERLAPGQTLLVHHVRRPAYLYPRLAEMGFQQETIDVGPDQVDIRIRRV